MKTCFIVTGANLWPELSNELTQKGLDFKMWLGPKHFECFAKEHHKGATVYPALELTKGAALKYEDLPHSPPAAFYTSEAFLRLKDQVYKMMDRQDDFSCYRRLEREAVFYSLLHYFYSELIENEIELVIATEGPHEPTTKILYALASMMGIRRVHFDISMVIPMMVMREGFEGKRFKVGKRKGDDRTRHHEIMQAYIDSVLKALDPSAVEPLYMTIQRKSDASFVTKFQHNTKGTGLVGAIKYSRRKIAKLFKPYYTVRNVDFLDTPLKPTLSQALEYRRNRITMKSKLKKQYLESVADTEKLSFDTPFIYFPLHYEPERTSNPDGGLYYNQFDALAALRDFVPNEVPIYVKEHYSQFTAKLHGHRGKSPYFWRVMKTLPNVHMLPMEMQSLELIKRSVFTASITGTASLESAISGKKAVIFGQTWFSGCPNVWQFDDLKDYASFVKEDTKPLDAVKDFFKDLVENYALRGYVSQTNEPYWRNKLEDAEVHLQPQPILDDIVHALDKGGFIKAKATKAKKSA